MKEELYSLLKTEGEPAGTNPCVDIILTNRDVWFNLHVRAGEREKL